MHRALRWLMRLTLALAAVLLLVLAAVKLRYGMGGEDFPDRSGAAQLPDTELEVVANLPSPPGNIAVSPTGRVFVSLHPEARPNTKVVELVNGVAVPFPDAAF